MKASYVKAILRTGAVLAAVFLFTPCARAVVVAGANGGANNTNNTTKSQLEASLGIDGFFFDHVVTAGYGNAVYIGYKNTDDGPVGYALSAMHLGTISGITIQGQAYTVTSQTAVAGSDLALLELKHASNIMPTLSALVLASSTPSNGTSVVMIGAGRNRQQDATTDPDTPDSISTGSYEGYTTSSTRLKRWGTNATSNFPPPGTPGPTRTFDIDGRNTVVFRTVFDKPASGQWMTTNEAQGVTNDSGGGVFAYDGTLLGIMAAVQTLDGNSSNALFDNTTLITNIASYKSDIDAITGGSLIPEPQTVLLLMAGIGFAIRSRNRLKVRMPRGCR